MRPGRVFITGHNANVLPCHLYHFMTQNGTTANTRDFYTIPGGNVNVMFFRRVAFVPRQRSKLRDHSVDARLKTL